MKFKVVLIAIVAGIGFLMLAPKSLEAAEPSTQPGATGMMEFPGAIFVSADTASMDAARGKIAARFSELDVLADFPESRPTKPTLIMELISPKDFGVPDDDTLRVRAKALLPRDRDTFKAVKSIWGVFLVVPDSTPFKYLRQFDEILLQLAQLSGGVIYDHTTRQYCGVDWWKTNRINGWTNGVPNVSNFITIDLYRYDELGHYRAVTLGMSKFALPDLVVNEMALSYSRSMGSLLHLMTQTIVERDSSVDAGPLAFDVAKIRHPKVRKQHQESIIAQGVGKAELNLRPAKVEEGDPEFLFEIVFDNIVGKGVAERHEGLLATVYGVEDKVTPVAADDEAINDASDRAKKRLPEVRQKFKKGLGFDEHLIVKGPFKTDDGSREWMWVEVRDCPDGEFKGVLINTPHFINNLKAGATVSVKDEDVFDYEIRRGNEVIEGGETSELLRTRMEQQAGE